ncbi:hypothetical protein I2I05_18840 [Hymenobacter sp. BT683]|uniref:Uncharacterized protein n=1 Tax=Hymenobacter jeongseonensis TaxID=2791027 RepID=A0ABS0IML6_9BACT|nr:hypothetical protein [Hymenobacter jeongseonensis]MBF9239457.1 hypothetical protein [Hymenobacter jeongseonensis]
MQRIHLRTVLAEIDQHEQDGQGRAFSLQYYKTDGRRGSKPAVRKGGLAGIGPAASPTSGGFRYKLKQKGTLQLVDCATNKSFALKIILLTHFNGQRIQHA